MCIIVVKHSGVEIPSDKMLSYLWKTNPHGGGFCYWVPGDNVVIGHKGFEDLPTFVKSIKGCIEKDAVALIHMRIATHGSRGPGATHPFPASSDLKELCAIDWEGPFGIAHNGVITDYGSKSEKGLSDTQDFIMKILHDRFIITGLFENRPAIRYIVEKIITSDRIAILRNDGGLFTMGTFHTDKETGLLFSNACFSGMNHSYGSQTHRDRQGKFVSEKTRRLEELFEGPGQPRDDDAPFVESGEEIEGVWAPSVSGSASSTIKCPRCGSFVYRSQIFLKGSQGVQCSLCCSLSDGVAAMMKSGGVSSAPLPLGNISTPTKTVSYEVSKKNGETMKGELVIGMHDKAPLVQALARRAKEMCGKHAEWWLKAHVPGRDDLVEIFSSCKFFVGELGSSMLKSYGGDGTKREMSNAEVMDEAMEAGIFLCTETNYLLMEGDCDCIHCGHFMGWTCMTGSCGSPAPCMDEEHQLKLRVVIGAKMSDLAPRLDYMKMTQEQRNEIDKRNGIEDGNTVPPMIAPTKEEVRALMEHHKGSEDRRRDSE